MKRLIGKVFVLVGLMLVSVFNLCHAKELVVFSGRKEPLIKPVIQLFESKTGIDVVLKTGKSNALAQQILQEQPSSSADVFIGKESGSLEYLRLKDVLLPYSSDIIKQIPQQFRAKDNSWIGVSGRSRAVLYNKDLVDESDVPTKLNDLLLPKYKGKIAAVNASNESLVAWMSALRLYWDNDQALVDFLNQLKQNDIALISKSHTDVRKSVGRGEYPYGLINHYYYHLQKNEQDSNISNVGIIYLDQDDSSRGELVNVTGAAIIKGAVHIQEAQMFLDFLASKETQQLFADVNFEYPLLPSVSANSQVLESLNCKSTVFDCLKPMDIHVDDLGPALQQTQQILDEVGWY